MAASSPTALKDLELIDAARAGDEEAFRRITEPHRPALLAHCYRMLGSLQDAEDAWQETLLRAWRGLTGFEGRSATQTWLYRIATNACLDAIARRPKRVLPIDYGPASTDHDPGVPLTEAVWVEPYPHEALGLDDGRAGPETRYEQREAVELAFIAALQHLAPRQRAVLILREVLGFSAREVSELLETSVPSVNSALQRARKTLETRLPDRSQQETLQAIGDDRAREIVAKYMDAWEKADVEALRALLTEDATFSMPPWPGWWRGRETILGFVEEAREFCAESRGIPIRAGGQMAIAYYHRHADTGRYVPAAIDVISLDGDRIKDITAFVGAELFPRFGLPPELVGARRRTHG
jgi:RNA polymerase sigma-70 factor, ECF subfamily